jgi:hypothetical protein
VIALGTGSLSLGDGLRSGLAAGSENVVGPMPYFMKSSDRRRDLENHRLDQAEN